jgi:hypothetical protein
MNCFYRIFLLLLFYNSLSQAQVLKGKITNESGNPIQYSTVYIQELKQGTTSNIKGDYEIKIPPGKYLVTYQSLGFSPVFLNLTITNQTIIKNVVLPVQYYEIPEVRITASGEDPAVIIMRKAIAMAPYYLNNISYYKAEVYLKGNLLINKIPKILQKSFKIESSDRGTSVSGGGKPKSSDRIIKEGESFLMESYNEMEFTAPDKYFQRVISFNSTFPEQGDEISPMDFIQASFYQPIIADMAISPLSPQAFSHYKFKYQGASPQGNFIINKIEVIPKRKSQQLFVGTIYIIEDLWCLHSVDLTNENLVGKIRVQQLYVPVQDDIWMPVSHKFEINIAIVGFKADAGYGASVKYTEVKPNFLLQKPKGFTSDYTSRTDSKTISADTTSSKTKKQIDKILEKDQLSNRDMVKLSRLMEKEAVKSIPDSTKKSLEIKDKTTHVIEKDASKKDSAYWATIRPIPLTDIDRMSIRISDSTKAAMSLIETKKDTTEVGKKETGKFIETVKRIGLGHTWSDTTGFSFTNGGIIDLKNLSFNTVDGFIYGFDFRFYKKWKNNKSLTVMPDIKWAFSREQLMWRINANYRFNGLKQRQLTLNTGTTSKDLGNGGGINTFLNSATTLLLKENYLKLYETKYITLGYTTELINGLNLEIKAGYEERKELQNTTNFSLSNSSKEYSDNIPDNMYLENGSNPFYTIRNQRHADLAAKLTYTPLQKYRIRNGIKSPRGSDWPTFNLIWKHGVNEFSELESKLREYDMIKVEASKDRSIGAFSNFRWRVSAGGFIDNTNLCFYDFFHFNPQPFPLLFNDYEDAFMLPDYYSTSTPDAYCEMHIKYTTPYLLLKLLPGLSNTLMRENLSFSYLGTRFRNNYSEIGYSISEVFFIGEIGIYAGFEDVRYKSIGGKLVLKFN